MPHAGPNCETHPLLSISFRVKRMRKCPPAKLTVFICFCYVRGGAILVGKSRGAWWWNSFYLLSVQQVLHSRSASENDVLWNHQITNSGQEEGGWGTPCPYWSLWSQVPADRLPHGTH